jgi:hypothetical protein
MGCKARAETIVRSVLHSKFSARFFHYFGNIRVIDVAHLGKKVVLNLKIQAPEQPALQSAVAGKVHGGFDLMYCPGVFHRSGTF